MNNIQINYKANDEGKEFTDEHKEIFKRAAHRATTIIQGVATNLSDTDLTKAFPTPFTQEAYLVVTLPCVV